MNPSSATSENAKFVISFRVIRIVVCVFVVLREGVRSVLQV